MNTTQSELGITRRQALKVGTGAITTVVAGVAMAAAPANDDATSSWPNPYRDIRGFNYQPSYEATGYSIWRQFQPEKFDTELGNGKKFFPKFNAVRYWLSFDAFAVDPAGFAEHFETAVAIAHRHGLRRHSNAVQQLAQRAGVWRHCRREAAYTGLSTTAKRERPPTTCSGPTWRRLSAHMRRTIAFWRGICATNRTITATGHSSRNGSTHTYGLCKELGATQPVSVSVQSQVQSVDAISDLFMIHPYFATADKLGEIVSFARQSNKGVLATECCWGSLDDAERVQHVVSDCGALAQAGIGFMPHALHESLVADLHRPQFGVISSASSMHFVAMDGSLRAGPRRI